MVYSEALLILILSILTGLVLFAFLRPIKLVTFDATYSETLGISVRRVDSIILMICNMIESFYILKIKIIYCIKVTPYVHKIFTFENH